jgi:hypothetical protein
MKFFGKVKDVVVGALRQGWTPKVVAWSVAWACTIAVFPIYGVTTITLGAIGWIWKLNHPILQILNNVMAPIKVLLIIPYVRLGEKLFMEQNPFSLSLTEFTLRFKDAPMETLGEFAMTFVHAIAGWAVTVPLWLFGTYFITQMVLKTGESAQLAIQEARS